MFAADFDVDHIREVCAFSSSFIRSRADYDTICRLSDASKCCPDVSIGNVIASTFHRPGCHSLNESDVIEMKTRLLQCAPWYSNGTLTHNCSETQAVGSTGLRELTSSAHSCLDVPAICAENNVIYNILHYLTDIEFVDSVSAVCKSDSNRDCSRISLDRFPRLEYTMLLLQAGADSQVVTEIDKEWFVGLYHDRLSSVKDYEDVKVAGFDLRIDYAIFQERILTETLYPSFSIILVFFIMWFYTGSVFITSMGCLAILSSIILAYFLYMVVFQVPSFGFLNLMAFIIVIGVGADDVFVYLDVWRQTKEAMPTASMTDWVSTTLRHAALSMFVTSFTTSVAFFSNIISPITAIKTFGVFAGTALLSNYVLMVSWLPAVVVVYERYVSHMCCTENGDGDRFRSCRRALSFAQNIFTLFYERYLSRVIIALKFPLAVGFLAFAIGMSFTVFLSPKLDLPSTERFQFFVSSDLLSAYITDLQNRFYFERGTDVTATTLPLFLWWGIEASDPGSGFDPDDKPLELDYQWPTPFVINEDMQQWFLDFCEAIKEQDFYRSTSSCFLEDLKRWQERLRLVPATCHDYTGEYRLCCNMSLPTEWQTLQRCLHLSTMDTPSTDSSIYGVKYDNQGNVRVITARIETDKTFTGSFEPMQSLWNNIEDFMVAQSASAPEELGRVLFSSQFGFMDLQTSLIDGTLMAVGVSLACSFGVLFITTLNIVISIYAIVSIGCILVSTVGTLALLGWDLGIFESVTIAIAVGLSVDFTVHLGVAYRLCREVSRTERTMFALNHMGPAITMAALTTFVAGSMMMPATILTYVQLGVFLMLIMTYSWVFANFFFLPVCAIMGPQHRFAQIVLPSWLDWYGQAASMPVHVTNEDVDGKSRKRSEHAEKNGNVVQMHAQEEDSSDMKGVVTEWVSSV